MISELRFRKSRTQNATIPSLTNNQLMKIAFDIDDVLADFMPSLLNFVSPILHKQFSESEMTYKEHYGEIWGVDLKTAVEIVGNFYKSIDFRNIKSNPDASILINDLLKRNVEIIALTSRPDFIKGITLTWLEEKFPGVFTENNTYFTSRFYGEKHSKGEICKQLQVDYLIEDDVKHVYSCIENNIKVIVLNKPWNERIDNTHNGIIRVSSLQEILELV